MTGQHVIPCEPTSGAGLLGVLLAFFPDSPGGPGQLLPSRLALPCVWTKAACPWSSVRLPPTQGHRGLRPVQAGGGFLLHRGADEGGSYCRWWLHRRPGSHPQRDQPAPCRSPSASSQSPVLRPRSPWPGVLPALWCSQQVSSWLLLAHSGRPCIPGIGWGPAGSLVWWP